MLDKAVAFAEAWLDAAPEDVTGMCGGAAESLWRGVSGCRWAFGYYGITSDSALSMPHNWVVYEDTIIDPTRCQFGGPRQVAVIRPDDPDVLLYHEQQIRFVEGGAVVSPVDRRR